MWSEVGSKARYPGRFVHRPLYDNDAMPKSL